MLGRGRDGAAGDDGGESLQFFEGGFHGIAAFNLGIADAAWAGGLIVTHRGLLHTPWIGALVVLVSLALTQWSGVLDRRAGIPVRRSAAIAASH